MKPPLNTRKAPDELQLVEGLKTNNRMGLDRDPSLTVQEDGPHPATWDDVVDSAIRASVIYYEHGYAQGWHDALDDRAANERQAHAARIAQDHMAVHMARQKSAARWSA